MVFEVVVCVSQMEQTDCCKQLMVNSLGLSVLDPRHLQLGVVDDSWLCLFPPRTFLSVSLLYKEVTKTSSDLPNLKDEINSSPYMEYFGGVVSDLSSLSLAISPLDRAQLLTSAFRKAMTGLSNLKFSKSTGKLDLGGVCDSYQHSLMEPLPA